MAPERTHDGYEAALRAKVSAWQAALDAYLAAKKMDGALGDSGGQSAPAGGAAFDLPMGALRKKSVARGCDGLECIPILFYAKGPTTYRE